MIYSINSLISSASSLPKSNKGSTYGAALSTPGFYSFQLSARGNRSLCENRTEVLYSQTFIYKENISAI